MYFNEDNDLVLSQEPKWGLGFSEKYYIPVKHVDIIYWNLIEGKDFVDASPVYPLTREQAAFILANYYPKGYQKKHRVKK